MSEITADDLHKEFKEYLQQVLKHPLVLGKVVIDQKDVQKVYEYMKSRFSMSKYGVPGYSVEDSAIELRSIYDQTTGKDTNKLPESSCGGVAGFQLPIGVKQRKKAVDEMMKEASDIDERQVLGFLSSLNEATTQVVCEALDLFQYGAVANLVREHATREAVRIKIREIVRKKKGGGGYTLYAPNQGKKHASKPLATYPSKLAAKRAELARFPPKDPKKMQRLRKEIERLMKDPKKRGEVERQAAKAKGTDNTTAKFAHGDPSKVAAAPVAMEGFSRGITEAAVLSSLVGGAVRRQLSEGLFQEERQGSEWDEYITKISSKVLQSDKGFQRIQNRMVRATEGALTQATKIIQKVLGAEARVRAAKKPGTTDGGQMYMPFNIELEAAKVGPIYLYVDKGLPAIEMSNEAKDSLTKVTPGAAKAIRAALATAQDSLEKLSSVQEVVAQRDAYLERLESTVDRMIAGMSPLQVSMLKQLLVKKYRSLSK
jgi:hypothetical protein